MTKAACQHQSRAGKTGQFNCALGWYGGKPWLRNCLDCLARGDNTPKAKAAFEAGAERSHPANRERLSGCCDRADQA